MKNLSDLIPRKGIAIMFPAKGGKIIGPVSLAVMGVCVLPALVNMSTETLLWFQIVLFTAMGGMFYSMRGGPAYPLRGLRPKKA